MLQQSCEAPGLQKHRWGCWLAASPPRVGEAARAGPIPSSPREPGGMAQASLPAICTPSSRGCPRPGDSAPHQPVFRAGSEGERKAAQTPIGPVLGTLKAVRAEHAGLYRTAGRRRLPAAPNTYRARSGFQPGYCLLRHPGWGWSLGCCG